MVGLLESILFSPYLTLGLTFIVLYKWVLRLVYNFEWNLIGAVLARLIFTITYGIIIYYAPPTDSVKFLVRLGINVLFLDELITWGIASRSGGRNILKYSKECIMKNIKENIKN